MKYNEMTERDENTTCSWPQACKTIAPKCKQLLWMAFICCYIVPLQADKQNRYEDQEGMIVL